MSLNVCNGKHILVTVCRHNRSSINLIIYTKPMLQEKKNDSKAYFLYLLITNNLFLKVIRRFLDFWVQHLGLMHLKLNLVIQSLFRLLYCILPRIHRLVVLSTPLSLFPSHFLSLFTDYPFVYPSTIHSPIHNASIMSNYASIMSNHPFICVHICSVICLSIYTFACLSVCLHDCTSICLYVYLPIYWSVCLPPYCSNRTTEEGHD